MAQGAHRQQCCGSDPSGAREQLAASRDRAKHRNAGNCRRQQGADGHQERQRHSEQNQPTCADESRKKCRTADCQKPRVPVTCALAGHWLAHCPPTDKRCPKSTGSGEDNGDGQSTHKEQKSNVRKTRRGGEKQIRQRPEENDRQRAGQCRHQNNERHPRQPPFDLFGMNESPTGRGPEQEARAGRPLDRLGSRHQLLDQSRQRAGGQTGGNRTENNCQECERSRRLRGRDGETLIGQQVAD